MTLAVITQVQSQRYEMPVETRPSNAHRWAKCSAAPLFASKSGPQPTNDAAREGTCAAWVADTVLKGQAIHAVDMLNETHENEWKVDLEMCGHVQSYVDMINAEGGFISAERFVRLSEHVAGTLDNSASFLNGVVRVRDFKYGFQLIEADAEQLIIYAGALVNELTAQGVNVTQVWTEIYQPRGFHVEGPHRRKKWKPDEIRERCQWLAERAAECHKPNPIATPGSWCDNCDGAAGCGALTATAKKLFAIVDDNRHRQMTAAELSDELTFLAKAKKIVTAAEKAVAAEATARNSTGEYIPGYYMKERFGHRKFTVGRDAIQAITGIDPVKDEMMSPAELKAAGAKDRHLSIISRRPSIGHKLAPVDENELKRQFERK